jgi:hypothetical protein
MGKADLVPFLGNTFMDWFPVLILVPALSALFNGPAFRWFGGNKQDDLENGQLDVSATEGRDLVLEGKNGLKLLFTNKEYRFHAYLSFFFFFFCLNRTEIIGKIPTS